MREAVVLAGGFGKRLQQVVPDLPKPMAPISGRPFLEILLATLARKGVDRVVLSLGFMAEKISGYFGLKFAGMDLIYVVEDKPLGTGGAVRLAMEKCHQDHFFVFNGDTFLDLEMDALDQLWHQNHRPVIVARHVPDTVRYGRLLFAKGRVTGFTEKGQNGLGFINAGCYVFNRGQLDGFALNKAFSLELDYLAKVVSNSPFDVFVTSGQFIDIGVPEDYHLAQNELAMR
jgi:D-glycero-alpha-D-manno-heptose 1-phosphate guanylyltransferase